MELFKSKESFKEKVDQTVIVKRVKMILESYLFLILSLGFVRKLSSFVEKYPNSYPKDVYSFSFFYYYYLNEEESVQQACARKYIENETFNSTSHKTKNKRGEDKKNKPTT